MPGWELIPVSARLQLPARSRRGDIVEIRLIIQHPMETGFRYDSLGQRTPRNAIRTVVCRYDAREIFRATLSTGIAANPYLRFFTRAVQSGDVEVSWVDDENASGSVSARLQVLD